MKQALQRNINNLSTYLSFDVAYFAKSGFWLNLNFFFSSIFSFILSIFLANLLTKEVFGNYQFILSMVGFIGAFTLTGMNSVVTKDTAQGFEGTLKSSIRPQLFANIVAFCIALGIGIWYLAHQNYSLAISFFLISVTFPLSSTFNTYSSFLVGKKLFKQHFLFSLLFNLVYYSSMIFVIHKKPELVWLIFAHYASTTIIHYFLHKKTLNYTQNENVADDFQDRAFHQSISNILPSLLLIFDSIVVYKLLGPSMLAVYSLISIVPTKIVGFLRSFITAASPKISQYSQEHVRKNIFKRSVLIFIFGIGVSLVYLIFAERIFNIFFRQYIDYVYLTYLFIVPAVLSLVFSFTTTSFILTQNKKNIYLYNTIYPIITIALLIIGGLYMGIVGIIFARAFGYLVSSILSIILMKRT